MRGRKARVALAPVALVVMLTASFAWGEEPKPEMSPEEMEMMKKFEAYATPGEPHQYLAKRAGSWTYTSKMWAYPGAEPTESSGTSKTTMIMDGRYLLDKTEGSFEGMPFTGMGITGYDNLNREFVGIWIDNFSTGIMVSHGSCDEAFEVCTYWGVAPDPISGQDKKMKMIERTIDADSFVLEMHDKTPDGKDFLQFEIRYKRAS